MKKTDLQKWNDHLDKLKIATEQWNTNDNVPQSDWTTEAITYAKNALEYDKTVAETLKSDFFDAINAKIDLEKGKFSEKTFALITEFNEAIEAKLKAMEDAAAAKEAAKKAVLEEPKPEPVVEQAPAPVETSPAPAAEEITQPQTTAPTNEPSQDLRTEWDNQLYKIETEGTTLSDTQKLLGKAYELARQLLSSQLSYPENLQFDFEDALTERAFNKRGRYPNLFTINFSDAMEVFAEATGIPMPTYDQQIDQFDQEQQRTAAERQEVAKKEREKELKIIAGLQKADITESKMQELNRLLQQKIAAAELQTQTEAARTKAETDTKIEQLRQELKIAKAHKAPEAPQGLLGTAIGAVKNVASAASTWWYGPNTAEEDQNRLTKLREILAVMALTDKEKQKIEIAWKNFIDNLRSAPQLSDTTHAASNNQWIMTIGQALEILITQYHILSLKDARDIIENILQPSDNRTQIIKEMRRYLKEKEQKNISEKQQQKADILKEEQQKRDIKEQKLRAQQRIKDEESRKEQEQQKHLSSINSYKQEENQWYIFLTQLAQNKHATAQENKVSTTEAIKKSQSLLNLAYIIAPKDKKNKSVLTQKLKSEFTNALLKQQESNEPAINVHQNMDHFNNAINKMME